MTQLMAPWSRVSFTVLDILLVALIIYEVLVMIRGTRAAPMLAGLAAVAVAAEAAIKARLFMFPPHDPMRGYFRLCELF